MKFFWDEERQMLWDSVTVKFKELDYLSWISTWTWHPQRKVIEYNSYGPEGRLISGVTKIVGEKKFVTIDKLYQPDGSFKELKDENFIESDTTHSNVSYEMKNGNWSSTGSYKWRRK